MLHVFIVNPYAGAKTFADDLRVKLSRMENLNYFVFNTRGKGDESVIVRKIQHFFDGEKLRFYCCGGSGTMCNMLSGFEDLSDVEIAFFPCGLTNDFLEVFGEERERFEQIEELIHGEVIDIDYIKTNYGIALNSVSVGMDKDIIERLEGYRAFGIFNDKVSYSLSTLWSAFTSKVHAYEICIDQAKWNDEFTEIFIGNGHVLRGVLFFEKESHIDDGEVICRIIPRVHGLRMLPILLALKRKQVYKLSNMMICGSCKKFRIKRSDGTPFTINMDGELIKNVTECEAKVVHKGLHLVIPRRERE